MKTFLLLALSLMALAAVSCQTPVSASTESTSITPTTPTTLRGVLHTGIVAIGGETTGKVLEYKDAKGQPQKIEVEVNAQTVGATLAKDGAHLVISGPIVVHHYVERGDVPRLVAQTIKADIQIEK